MYEEQGSSHQGLLLHLRPFQHLEAGVRALHPQGATSQPVLSHLLPSRWRFLRP